MPVEKVTRILDSFDEKELPVDTEPVRLTLGRRAWDLYLSPANRKKLDAQIDTWTAKEPESVAASSSPAPRARRSAARSSSEDLTAVREWAREHGYKVSDRGRIKADIWEAYRAAN